MKLLLFAFLASSAAAAEFGGRRPALRALQQDEQLIDVQQDSEFSTSMASAGSAMEGEAKSAKSSKLLKSSKTEICVPPSDSTDPLYPDAEQKQMLLHQATDGGEDLSGEDLSYLTKADYNMHYGKNEMKDKILTFAGRLPSKDFPSNVAVIFGEDLGFLNPCLLGLIDTEKFGRVTAEFIPSRIDVVNSVLDAKSLCATICEKLSNCIGFEFVKFNIDLDDYNCVFIKEGIAVVSDYPSQQFRQTSLLLKDPSQFNSSNWCDVPQGAAPLTEALDCYGLFSARALPASLNEFYDKGCLEVGKKATFLLPILNDTLNRSGHCISKYFDGEFNQTSIAPWNPVPYFPKDDCIPLIEEDFVKHIIPATNCLFKHFAGNAEGVNGCLDCVFEKAADTCASVCDEEDDGTATFLKPCECADDDEQCECKCKLRKTCGDVCPPTECTAKIQSAVLCSVGTGPFDEYTGCINSNINGSPEFLENDFECAYSVYPDYPNAEQQEKLLRTSARRLTATDGEIPSDCYLSEDDYDEMYGKNEMMDKVITYAGRVPSKDFPSNVAAIYADDLGFIIPELLEVENGYGGGTIDSDRDRFFVHRIDEISIGVLDAKSLCATICEELPSCLGFEFVEFNTDGYYCIFIKEGIAVISDYPQRPRKRFSLLLKDPSQFISENDANFCNVPQGEEELGKALECFKLFSALPASLNEFFNEGCPEVGVKAAFLLDKDVASVLSSGACITTYLGGVFTEVSWDDLPWNPVPYFPKEDCIRLIEEDFVKHIIPAVACISELSRRVSSLSVDNCLGCVVEKAADTCASVCDEEEDGTATFLKPCECADDDEQCELDCKTCGDVCPQPTEQVCKDYMQSAILCSVGTGVYGEYHGCINSNIDGSPQILEKDFGCAFKEDQEDM